MKRHLVVPILGGGLGNQLFQVAAAMRAGNNRLSNLRLNDRFLTAHYTKRVNRIPELGLPLRRIGPFGHLLVRALRWLNHVAPRVGILRQNAFWCYMCEPSDREIVIPFQTPASFLVVLDGYWQHSSYADGCLSQLRECLVRPALQGPNAADLAKVLESTESVALHVRRGDYVNDPSTRSFHGNCSEEYYYQAIELLNRRVRFDRIFVFSDDITWVSTHLSLGDNATYMNTDRALSDVEEFKLMARCHHFIIANSTFSWWAARLAMHREKVVIAPERWFAQAGGKERGLFPEDWVLI